MTWKGWALVIGAIAIPLGTIAAGLWNWNKETIIVGALLAALMVGLAVWVIRGFET
jgi:hypothetical protein